ncbi:hypothetical protein QE152_g38873 [Popillia japonica]|uniref:Uncharacterized protein n=1 Tax=Popillia japonica TaxID=7064 RepID=A0AAW1HVA9_POPJA
MWKKFEPVSSRISLIRVEGKYRNITLINVHAPTESKEIERISLIRVEGKYRNITLINVHAPTESKEIEEKVLFYEELGKVVANVSKTKDIRVYRKADVGSDHFLVILKLKEEIQSKSTKNHKIVRYNTDFYKDEDIRAKYQARLEQKMLSTPVALELTQKWKNVEEAILLAAKVLQEPQRKKYEGWFGEECKRVLEERAKMKLKMQRKKYEGWFGEECKRVLEERAKMKLKMVTKSSEKCKEEEYQESRRKAKQTCRKKEREFFEAKLEKIENSFKDKDIRKFYKEITSERVSKTRILENFIKKLQVKEVDITEELFSSRKATEL